MKVVEDQSREISVDALRGVSIIAVMLYHYRPFGSGITDWGLYGVTLFFMISGYCMLPSLRSSFSLRHFLSKRVARLFPALVICGLLSTVIERVAMVRPDRLHGFADWIKSSICLPTVDIPCAISGIVFGRFHEYSYPDGAYWTLATEFKFYLFIGLIYWGISRHHTAVAFATVLIGAQFFWTTGAYIRYVDQILPYLPVFLCGVAISEFTHGDRKSSLVGMTASAIVMALMYKLEIKPYSMPVVTGTAIVAFVASFAALLLVTNFPEIGDRLGVKWLAMVGAYSYPLYLLHQDIGLVLLEYLRPFDEVLVKVFILPVIMMIAAYVVCRTVEYRWQAALIRLFAGTPRMQSEKVAT